MTNINDHTEDCDESACREHACDNCGAVVPSCHLESRKSAPGTPGGEFCCRCIYAPCATCETARTAAFQRRLIESVLANRARRGNA